LKLKLNALTYLFLAGSLMHFIFLLNSQIIFLLLDSWIVVSMVGGYVAWKTLLLGIYVGN